MALVYIHMGGQVLFMVLSTGLIKQTFRNLPFLLLVGLVTPATSPSLTIPFPPEEKETTDLDRMS
jgi:hypothetical protein